MKARSLTAQALWGRGRMLDEREAKQLFTAIRLMSSPMSVGGRETCFKDRVQELIEIFVERTELTNPTQG